MIKNLKITIYTANSSISKPFQMAKEMIYDLLLCRELAWQLAIRDLKAQYRQAFLGFLWVLILPLANTLLWVILSTSGVVVVKNIELPYPVYVFCGTMLWSILMDSINAPLQQTSAAKGMLAKLNFPREALILSGIYQTLFNGIIKIVLLFGTLLVLGCNFGWHIVFFPFAFFSLILVGTVIGLLLTPMALLYGDIAKGLPLLLQFLMYFTPVVMPAPKDGVATLLFSLNPLTPIILTSRNWFIGMPTQDLFGFLLVNFFSIFLLVVVWIVFRLAMPILIERMGS